MTFTDDDLKRLKEWNRKRPVDAFACGFGDSFVSFNALLARLEASERMEEYICHDEDCILNRWEVGEPTPDGGYRTKYAGKWYQSKPINKEPKCNCGLSELFEAWRKAAGK